ncbi:hypothetical protein EDB87DRAFT_1578449 [Lactarius vividus]|nr:hypothetical protein EDB87DRAFT_1578449 [Lactarius vividus]
MAQVLNQTSAMLSDVVHLEITFDGPISAWQDDINDDIEWLELFRPFTVVKKLRNWRRALPTHSKARPRRRRRDQRARDMRALIADLWERGKLLSNGLDSDMALKPSMNSESPEAGGPEHYRSRVLFLFGSPHGPRSASAVGLQPKIPQSRRRHANKRQLWGRASIAELSSDTLSLRAAQALVRPARREDTRSQASLAFSTPQEAELDIVVYLKGLLWSWVYACYRAEFPKGDP